MNLSFVVVRSTINFPSRNEISINNCAFTDISTQFSSVIDISLSKVTLNFSSIIKCGNFQNSILSFYACNKIKISNTFLDVNSLCDNEIMFGNSNVTCTYLTVNEGKNIDLSIKFDGGVKFFTSKFSNINYTNLGKQSLLSFSKSNGFSSRYWLVSNFKDETETEIELFRTYSSKNIEIDYFYIKSINKWLMLNNIDIIFKNCIFEAHISKLSCEVYDSVLMDKLNNSFVNNCTITIYKQIPEEYILTSEPFIIYENINIKGNYNKPISSFSLSKSIIIENAYFSHISGDTPIYIDADCNTLSLERTQISDCFGGMKCGGLAMYDHIENASIRNLCGNMCDSNSDSVFIAANFMGNLNFNSTSVANCYYKIHYCSGMTIALALFQDFVANEINISKNNNQLGITVFEYVKKISMCIFEQNWAYSRSVFSASSVKAESLLFINNFAELIFFEVNEAEFKNTYFRNNSMKAFMEFNTLFPGEVRMINVYSDQNISYKIPINGEITVTNSFDIKLTSFDPFCLNLVSPSFPYLAVILPVAAILIAVPIAIVLVRQLVIQKQIQSQMLLTRTVIDDFG